MVGIAEGFQDTALLFDLLRLERRGCRTLGGFVDGLAQGAGGGGLEIRIRERSAGRHFRVHRLHQEVGEEVRLADAVNVEAELEKLAGEGTQAVESLLLPVAFDGQRVLDQVGGVGDPVFGEAGTFARLVEPGDQGVGLQVAGLQGDFGRRGVVALVGHHQFEHAAGIGDGGIGISGDLQRVTAAVEQGVAKGDKLRRILRRREQLDAFVEATAGLVVVRGHQPAVRAGKGEPLEGGGVLLVRELP